MNAPGYESMLAIPSVENFSLAPVTALVAEACGAYDQRAIPMPEDEITRHLADLTALCDDPTDGPLSTELAQSLLAEARQRPSHGVMDQLMRRAILERGPLSDAILFHLGIDSMKQHSLVKVWDAGYGPSTMPNGKINPASQTREQYTELCAQRVFDIERVRPGGAGRLSKRYGIRNIGRVPKDWLLDTIDNGHKPHKRVIFAVFGSGCPNGALKGVAYKLNEARKTLPEDTIMVPVEIENVGQLTGRMEFLERARGVSGNPAEVTGFIMVGHGNSAENGKNDKIMLGIINGGRGSRTESLRTTDITGVVGDLALRLLVPDAPGLVISCGLARMDDCFVARLSERIQREVTGLCEPGNLGNLQIAVLPDGSVRFIPQFQKRVKASPTEWQYVPMQGRTFSPPQNAMQTDYGSGLAQAA